MAILPFPFLLLGAVGGGQVGGQRSRLSHMLPLVLSAGGKEGEFLSAWTEWPHGDMVEGFWIQST